MSAFSRSSRLAHPRSLALSPCPALLCPRSHARGATCAERSVESAEREGRGKKKSSLLVCDLSRPWKREKKTLALRLLRREKEEMLFTDLPERGPDILGGQPRYHLGNWVNVTCISRDSLPAASLEWYINGEKADRHFLIYYPEEANYEGLRTSRLGMAFKVQWQSFISYMGFWITSHVLYFLRKCCMTQVESAVVVCCRLERQSLAWGRTGERLAKVRKDTRVYR